MHRDRDRRDGRRPRAGGDRRGRAARPSASSTSTSCSSGSPTRSRAHLPGGVAPDGVEVLARVRSHRDGRRARGRGPHEEGLVARARRRGGARRPGRTRWSAPATPAPRWPPRCCGCGRIRGVHRPAIAVPLPVFGARPLAAPRRRRRDRRSRNPSGSSSGRVLGRAYARVRLGVDEPTVGAALERRGAGQGRRAAQGRVRRCSREVKGFVGNVEGRDLMRAARRRDRHRRLHRQRRAEDARRRDARARRARVRRARRARSARRWPTRSKLRMLEAAAPLLPDNTGGAVLLGVERRVRDLARLVVGDRDRQRGARRARLRDRRTSSTGSPTRRASSRGRRDDAG